MSEKFLKRILSITIVLVLVIGSFSACGKKTDKQEPSGKLGQENKVGKKDDEKEKTPNTKESEGGTIMWLSNLTSGISYDTAIAYATMILDELGYKLQVIYGDMYNDPAGNLNAVRNGMTRDVVGLIMSQDGGIKDIMAEYPDLYVVGYNTDMLSVFAKDGDNAEVASNPKFLGTICDGYYDGRLLGSQMAQAVIKKGYKKLTTVVFPAFAYPNLTDADKTLREEIDKHNKTASEEEKIQIIGETKVLEFQPLEENYFLEDNRDDLDAIVALCAGIEFVYPTMKSAMANGSCSTDTKLITSGFNDDEAIIADIGDDGVIQFITVSPAENIAWPIIMLDNALYGVMNKGYVEPERINSLEYVIDSKEDIENIMSKSMFGTADVSLAQLTMDDIKTVLTRYNPDATYEELYELFHSYALTVDALKDR